MTVAEPYRSSTASATEFTWKLVVQRGPTLSSAEIIDFFKGTREEAIAAMIEFRAATFQKGFFTLSHPKWSACYESSTIVSFVIEIQT